MNRTPLRCLGRHVPQLRTFQAEEVGADYAVLRWTVAEISPTSRYDYELSYVARGADKRSARLSGSRSATVLRNLKSNSNYTASIYALNECAKSRGAPLLFTTKAAAIHPAITQVMPHEVLLTLVVLALWMFILRHFFTIYTKVTFVSPLTAMDRKQKKSTGKKSSVFSEMESPNPQRTPSRPRSASALSTSNDGPGGIESRQAKKSDAFTLLQHAVHTWRSETVLSSCGFRESRLLSGGGFVGAGTSVNDSSRLYRVDTGGADGGPGYGHFDYSGPSSASVPASRKPTVMTGTSLSPTVSASESATRVVVLTEEDPERATATAQRKRRATDDDSETQSPSGLKKGWRPMPTFRAIPTLSSSDSILRKNGQLLTSRPSPSTRKVSEVLLGKATIDIRRCSSLTRAATERCPNSGVGARSGRSSLRLKRRGTLLLASLKLGNSRRRHKKKMDMVSEEALDTIDGAQSIDSRESELLNVPHSWRSRRRGTIRSSATIDSFRTATDQISITIDPLATSTVHASMQGTEEPTT